VERFSFFKRHPVNRRRAEELEGSSKVPLWEMA
jgi:hypothetical protein